MRWWGKFKKRNELEAQRPFEANLRVRAEHLNRVLARERTRADRSGRPLSMVLLGYAGKSQKREDASIIVHVMQQRARITDEVGWFDKHTGYAVLPDTPTAGGKRFAQIVCQQLRERGVHSSYAIYQYAPPRDENDHDHQNGSGRGMRQLDRQPADRRASEPMHAVVSACN